MPRKVKTKPKPKEPLKCSNCNKPVNVRFKDHCECSIWDRGKMEASGE